MNDDLEQRVGDMVLGFRFEEAVTGLPTYTANIIQAVRESLAAEIMAEGDKAQADYNKADEFHALSPLTCNRLAEARFFAGLVRGEQQ